MEENLLHHRQSIRLSGYDYSSPGAYFITIRTNHEDKIFGHLWNGKMYLNEFGQIVRDEWLKSFEIRHEIVLDEFVILPDHFHAIVWIVDSNNQFDCTDGQFVNELSVGANGHSPLRCIQSSDIKPNPFQMRPKSISSLITGFKSPTTIKINDLRNIHNISVWQRGFYDRIIRDEIELTKKRQYVLDNPLKHWNKQNQINYVV